ncbi:hypothetical protein PVE_R1G2007 [Pseudomonas veronii 1YdBTEX2]|uniref:Uncharacterized protein n=1 Tax=Pseudomonas veronii 1YdBTEX2 TaxID=1295141 RepID=A0A1D3JUX7_PSEVE|nr:hypothetical protein [Pseudomonas veronii]SBW79893.1 hypothetical protein PVE_R1G2007 [Pseudomonas veronii 1YdBTEX2]
MKYRKPTEHVDAMQYTGANLDEVMAFCSNLVESGGFGFTDRVNGQLVMNSAAGTERAMPGDWIVMIADGSLKAMKLEAFAATYELDE